MLLGWLVAVGPEAVAVGTNSSTVPCLSAKTRKNVSKTPLSQR